MRSKKNLIFVLVLVILSIILALLLFFVWPKINHPTPIASSTLTPSPTLKPINNLNEERIGSIGKEAIDYTLKQTVVFANNGLNDAHDAVIYIALAPTMMPFQKINSLEISPNNYELIDDELGNRYAKFTFGEIKGTNGMWNESAAKTITLDYKLELYSFVDDYLNHCQGEMPRIDASAETYIESDDPEIINLAKSLSATAKNDCQAALNAYNYVDNIMTYEQNVSDGGAVKALHDRVGDCTDYSDLFTALTRSLSIPTQYYTGLMYREDTADLNQIKHNWPHVYLPGIGFSQVDLTFGQNINVRDQFFAAADGNHLAFTRGRNPILLNGFSFVYYNYEPEPGEQSALWHSEDYQFKRSQ